MIKCKSLVILFMIFFISCSQEAPKTEAQFTLNFSAIAGGETMLWAENRALGASFARVVTNEAFEMDLVNGVWDFYLINWESSANGALTGKVKCDAIKGIELNGGEVPLDFYLANASCDNSLFAPAFLSDNTRAGVNVGEYRFPQIGFKNCERIDAINDPSGSCNTVSGNRGNASSMKLTLISFDENAPGEIPLPYGQLQTACFPFGALSGKVRDTEMSLLNFPIGNSGESPVRTVVELFSDSDCISPAGAPLDLFRGIHAPDNVPLLGALKSFSSANGYNFFVTSSSSNPFEICNPTYVEGEFSAGRGTFEDPFIICHPEEFNLIGDDPLYLSSHFRLGRDIDFSTLLFNLNYSPFVCANAFEKINPVGGNDCTSLAPPAFEGSFDGDNFTIRNLILPNDDYNYMGLFRIIGQDGVVQNLKIKDSLIEGKAFVGALTGSNEGRIENIDIVRSLISARGKQSHIGDAANDSIVGGAIGISSPSPSAHIFDVHVYDTEIEGEGDYIGGVVGAHQTINDLVQLSFSGEIYVEADNESSPPIKNTGGIVGSSQGDILLSKSSGLISGHMINAGGIAGELSVNSSIQVNYNYSNMVINSSFPTGSGFVYIGGIVGKGSSTNIVESSYFNGTIDNRCTASPGDCKVGSISGDGTNVTAATSTYSHQAYSLGGAEANYSLEDFYNGSVTSSLLSANFAHIEVNDFPRLYWESGEHIVSKCMTDPSSRTSVATQRATRGSSSTNPIIICSPDQYLEFKSNRSYFYALENPIPMHSFTSGNELTPSGSTFAKTFDGNNHYFYGYSNTSLPSLRSLFGEIDAGGVIKNLKVYNFEVGSSSFNNYGILTFNNAGTIFNISIVNSHILPNAGNQIGLVAGTNNFKILDINIDRQSKIAGLGDYYGLISGLNTSDIKRVSIEGELKVQSDDSVNYWGGVTGDNQLGGNIDQISFSGTLDLSNISDMSSSKVGGISGSNAGVIRDIKIEKYSHINLGANANFNGHVTGYNTAGGDISNIISEALLIHSDIPGANDGTIAGDNSLGSIDSSTSLYLFNPGQQVSGAITGRSDDPGSETCRLTFSSVPNTVSALRDSNSGELLPVLSNSGTEIVVDYSNLHSSSTFTCAGASTPLWYAHTAITLNGTKKTKSELVDYTTYCSGGRVPNDPSFRCEESFDSVYDGFDSGEYTSIEFILGNVTRTIKREPAGPLAPKWIVEAGRTPELYFDW